MGPILAKKGDISLANAHAYMITHCTLNFCKSSIGTSISVAYLLSMLPGLFPKFISQGVLKTPELKIGMLYILPTQVQRILDEKKVTFSDDLTNTHCMDSTSFEPTIDEQTADKLLEILHQNITSGKRKKNKISNNSKKLCYK